MINNKTPEKQEQPRIFQLWDEIVNGSKEEEENKKEGEKK